MVLGFGQQKGAPAKGAPARSEDITALITKKQYAKAIEVIRAQLKTQSRDPRLRMQLADVLVLAGKSKEAVMILTPVADEYAKEGFAAKAISVLKKIQKIEPGRRDVDAKLASLIQEKQRVATVSPPTASREMPEFGMEEIGLDIGGSVAVPADDRPAPLAAEPPSDELDFGSAQAPTAEVSFAPEVAPPPVAPAFVEPEAPATPPTSDLAFESEPFQLAIDPAGPPVHPDEVVILPDPMDETPTQRLAPIVDRDLISDEDEPAELTAEILPELEAEPETGFEPSLELSAEVVPEGEAGEDQMSESAFAEELLSAIDEAFADLPVGAEEALPLLADAPSDGGNQIVVSPLFKDFSVDELVEVIHGLNLITFEEGDIIIRQGEPGDSLYMLTAGAVNAFKKNAQGKQILVSELNEGAFFGEMSILSGKARSATIVAASHCELLELDRATLDSITAKHPHVWQVLQDFAEQRMSPRA